MLTGQYVSHVDSVAAISRPWRRDAPHGTKAGERVMIHQRIVLSSRPQGVPVPENFRTDEAPVPELTAGQVLLETLVLAIDPAVRGMVGDVTGRKNDE